MWNRLKRLFRSIFGGIIDSAEDPELILQQVIRDMRDKVLQMNNNVAQVMANEKLLGRNVEQMANKITELDGSGRPRSSSGATTSPPPTSASCSRPRRILKPPSCRCSRPSSLPRKRPSSATITSFR